VLTNKVVKIAEEWQKAVNEKNILKLLELSDEQIEMAGPRGSVSGHQHLADWLSRAGLTLTTINKYERNNTVVLEQHAVWKDGKGTILGEANVASLMKVENGKVTYVARYDNDLEKALNDAKMSLKDKV